MSFEEEQNRLDAGLSPTTLGQMIFKYLFWFIVGGILLYFFGFNVFEYLRF